MKSDKKPFFSVVIPLYNKQSHVKETIKTVFNQTFQNYEIVVVNDGSTDESVKIVKSLQDNRIRLIHQENAGVSVARNRGIEEANAEYIVFLDADDLWLPEFLETIYHLINDFPDAGLYTTSYKLMNAKKEYTDVSVKTMQLEDYVGLIPYLLLASKEGNIAWTSATCIPKKVFLENNIFFPVGEKYGEDSHVWMRVAAMFDVAYNSKACSIYCIEAENNTLTKVKKEKEPRNSVLMLNRYRNRVRSVEELKYFDKYIENHIRGSIQENILNGEKLFALRQIFKYKLSLIQRLKLLTLITIPGFSYEFLKKTKRKIKNFYGHQVL